MNKRALAFEDYIFSAGVVIDNIIYFFTEKENALMEADIENCRIKYSEKFDGCDLYFGSNADFLRTHNEKIYKLVLDGTCIEEFSLRDGLYKKIPLGNYDKQWDNFIAFETEKQYLYIFPKWENIIIRIDTINCKKESFGLLTKDNKFQQDKKFTCFMAACRCENVVWLFESNSQRVVAYDLGMNVSTLYVLPDEINNCVTVCCKDGLFYLLLQDNRIFIWHPATGECKQLFAVEKCFVPESSVGGIFIVEQKIILLPSSLGKDIVILNLKDGTSVRYDGYPEDFTYLDLKWGKYVNRFEDDDHYYYPMRVSNYLMIVNKVSGEIQWKKMVVPSMEERVQFRLKYGKLIGDDLETFLAYIKSNSVNSVKNGEFKMVGEDIWRMMTNM